MASSKQWSAQEEVGSYFNTSESSKFQNGGPSPTKSRASAPDNEQALNLTKADLDISLESLLNKIMVSFKAELKTLASEFTKEINSLGVRTDTLETKHNDLLSAHSTLQLQVESLQRAVTALTLKTEDLENRSRRHNIRIRNVSCTDMQQLLELLFSKLLPEYSPDLLLVDRAHRELRTKPLPNEPPRDIIVRLHFCETKEDLIRSSRIHDAVELDGQPITIYPDVARATLQKRKDLRPVTSILQQAGLKYRWGFPFKLLVVRNKILYSLTDPAEGPSFLSCLGLVDPPASPPSACMD